MSGIATQGQTILRDSVAHRQLDKYYLVPNISQKQYITDLAEYIPHASNNATDISAYHIVGNISYPELRLCKIASTVSATFIGCLLATLFVFR